ncbi:hypothetical protein N7466_008730 [Penicillium verhagenii]|uniref:uncharacterized protein n=1 Tax=Penicillium verhagenii TaxID=1562060 RepID=UPI0025458C3F|nr:uncharacterized protein N7466_008730 [Penicillium verhagenii]KAJ5924543.1 hypothetical protein N7466_008730 [Penicillium verhagenii]
MQFQVPLSIITFLTISGQTLGASLFGLYRIQQTFNGEDLVLTGQGNDSAPTFETPAGEGSQIWRFEDQGDNTTIIESVATKQYLNCDSGSCLESATAQTFYVEYQGPYQYTFLDLSHGRSLHSTDESGIALARISAESDDQIFEVIRVEFCE